MEIRRDSGTKITSALIYIQTLLRDTYIVAGKELAKICEVELYYHSKSHPDPFVHKAKEQKRMLCWYFHRQNDKGFKNGTYKGLDITYGNENVFCGILIRSIMVGCELIEGPCKVVDWILTSMGYDSIQNLVNDFPEKDWFPINGKKAHPMLRIQTCHHIRDPDIYAVPRFGLTLKKLDNIEIRFEYICKPYRFISTLGLSDTKKGKALIDLNVNGDKSKYFDLFSKAKNLNKTHSLSSLREHFLKNDVKTQIELYGFCFQNYK